MNLTQTPANNCTVNQSGIQIYSLKGNQSLATALETIVAPARPYQINNISLFFYDALGVASVAPKDIFISIIEANGNPLHVIYDEEQHNSWYLSIVGENIRQESSTKLKVTCSENSDIANAVLIIDYEVI